MSSEFLEKSKEQLGEILIRRGKVTELQVHQALDQQAKEHKLLGEILVSMGCLDEADIVAAVITQCGVPYVAINKYDVPAEVINLIPKNLVQEFRLLPVDQTDQVLSVVMADPLNQSVVKKLSEVTGLKISPFIATNAEMNRAIAKYFP